MPLWAPPTPPQDDNDLYIDQTVHFMYDPSVMTESQLPPVYIKKEHKKIKIENVRKHKGRKDEQVRVPRSLFDRPSAALVKLRREAKLAKMNKGIFRAPTGLKLPTVPNTLESSSDQADWFIHEDWALLQAVQMLMDVPLNLMIISPAHIPNWDLVADVVNGVSRVYRSAKQCKNRYESVIIPREEGRILYDINPRKQKKNKGIYKTKNNRPMKTSQINLQDNNHHVTNLFTLRFDSVKSLASRRSPTLRPTLANPSSKNPKHVAVLTDSGITYDQPMTPIQVAKIRAERIAREKKQNQAVAEQRAAQLAQQQQQQQAGAQTVVTVAGSTAIAGVTTAMQGTATTILTGGLPKASLTGGATAVSIPRTLSPGSIVVNTASPVVSAALTQAIRTTRTAAGQEITAVVANPVTAQTPGRVTTVSGAQVITTTFNTAQLLAAQRAVSSGTTTTVAGQTLGIKTTGAVQQQLMQAKSLTPHQLSMFKTQQILKRQQTQQIQQARLATLTPAQAEQLKQQQQLKRLQAQGASVVGTVQKTVAVTTPLLTSVSQAATVAQTARLQAAKGTTLKHTTVARQMTREDMAALIKQQTALQHKTGSTQIFAQAQVQAVQQGTSSTPQVATLVKTVSTPGSVPSVTIPVSAVSVSGMNVSISLPQQKTTTGKMTTGTTQVRHQLQLQQLAQQRKSALHQQKVATLTQSQVQQLSKSQLGTQLGAVQIIPQQPKLTPTMIQQLVKQQTGSGQTAPTIQQIITSVTQAASSTATVITTPIVTQAASPSHKVSLPAGIVTTSLGQASRTGSVIGVTNVATSAANTTVTSTGTTQTVTVTIANSPVTNASGVTHGQTLMKPIQELVVSPAKALPTSSAVAQHLKTVSRPAQMVTISQGHQVQVKGSTMSVQQVVQQVQAQAQAQQAAQQRITTIPVTAAAASASPSVTVTQAAVSQSAQSTPQSVTQVSISTTTAQGTPQQQQAHAQAQARGTPYSMRLRNK